MTIPSTKITIAEFETFLADHPDGLYELINGQIVERRTTEQQGVLVGVIGAMIRLYLNSRNDRVGIVAAYPRYQPQADGDNDLLPCVAFRRTEGAAVTSGAVQGVPDLAVEIKSPDDQIKQMRQKAQIYLEHGTAIVWLVYPDEEIIEVYTPDNDIQLLKRGDTLSGGDVLPNFTLDVDTVFDA